ncbi:hypothetical protein J4418_03305 [Candidatus Woesearchaeota archaeon]|nr:hypothetical protein [Candidatus Woesearchaeota archaeon]
MNFYIYEIAEDKCPVINNIIKVALAEMLMLGYEPVSCLKSVSLLISMLILIR